MERSTIFHGKIHYFDWSIFHIFHGVGLAEDFLLRSHESHNQQWISSVPTSRVRQLIYNMWIFQIISFPISYELQCMYVYIYVIFIYINIVYVCVCIDTSVIH